MSSTDPRTITRTGNSTVILDNIFRKYGWVKEERSCDYDTRMVYTTQKDFFSKFVVERTGETSYKVAMPLSDTRYCYTTNIYSVFELLDYVDNVLQSREKKVQ